MFHRWTALLVRWLRGLLKSRSPVSLKLKGEFYSDQAALYRFQDPTIPGCVDAWKAVHRYASADLLILLISLPQLKQELGGLRPVREDRLQPWQSSLATQLEAGFKAQAHVDGSHLVIVAWLRQAYRTDSKNRRYRASVADFVGCWVCDLQKLNGELASDRWAKIVVEAAARKVLKIRHTEQLTWEEVVKAVNWLEWFTIFAQEVLTPTSKDHVLQPPRRRRPQS